MNRIRVLTQTETRLALLEFAARRLGEPLQHIDHHRTQHVVDRLKVVSGAIYDKDDGNPPDRAA